MISRKDELIKIIQKTMDSRERKLLAKVCENLVKSTKTEWYTGNLDQWSEYAKKMKACIADSVGILKTIMEDETPSGTSEEDLIEKNLK